MRNESWKIMLEIIAAVNKAVNDFIWGVPAMVCIIGVGLLLAVREKSQLRQRHLKNNYYIMI